jgi:hypothetical protein
MRSEGYVEARRLSVSPRSRCTGRGHDRRFAVIARPFASTSQRQVARPCDGCVKCNDGRPMPGSRTVHTDSTVHTLRHSFWMWRRCAALVGCGKVWIHWAPALAPGKRRCSRYRGRGQLCSLGRLSLRHLFGLHPRENEGSMSRAPPIVRYSTSYLSVSTWSQINTWA